MGINEVISKRLERLHIYLSRLEEISKLPEAEFTKDWRSQDIALRNLQVSIEACLDIGGHIISILGGEVPDTYAEIAEALAKKGVLPADFAAKFEDIVKFRNIIVHDYLYLDLRKVYTNLQKFNLIRQFAEHTVNFLESRQEE